MNKDIFNKKFHLLDVEKSLLALILTKRGVIDDVVSILKKDDFDNGSDTINKTVYDLCIRCYERYKYVSIPAVIDEIKNSGVIRLASVATMDINQYVESLGVMLIRDDNHIGLANILKEASIRRKIFIATSEIQFNLLNNPFDNPNFAISSAEKIFSDCVNKVDRGSDRPVNIYSDIAEALEETKHQDYTTKGHPCPYPTIQKIFGSLTRPGNITLFTSRSGVGKALSNTEKVRMGDGSLKFICDIQVGDKVYSNMGRITTVEGVYPQGRRRTVRFLWEDGRKPTTCDYDHLWEVCSFIDSTPRVEILTSSEIYRRIKGGQKLYIPISYFSREDCLSAKALRPYRYLGKYFRDGKLEDNEEALMFEFFKDFEGLENRHIEDLDFERLPISGKIVFLKEYLNNNPLFYIRKKTFRNINNINQSKNESYTVNFATTNDKFGKTIVNFFRSIGGVGKMHFNRKDKNYKVSCSSNRILRAENRRNGSSDYQLRNTSDFIKIYDVELAGKKPCTCIKVKDASHLFLLENNVLTHNTQITMDIATKISEKYNVPILHFDNGEMSERELQYRRLSALSGVNYYDIESGKWCQSPSSVAKLKRAIAETEGREFFYYQIAGRSFDEMRDLIKSFYENICKGGQMLFCFDYMKPSQNGTFNEQEHQYLGRLMDKFKTLIHDEIKVNGKPVISMLTSVQSNKLGIVAKKSSNEMEDSENVFGLSDRLIHYASHCAILRNNTNDETLFQGKEFGTHKLIFIKGRFLGEDTDGYLKLVEMPDGSLRKNSINLDFSNFSITDKGDLRDIVRSLSACNTTIKKAPGVDVPF